MKTILYRIPDKYFPAVRIIKPFYSKVNYKVANGEVDICDAAFSGKCLKYLTNNQRLLEQMKKDIAEAENKKSLSNIHPVMEQALFPAIMHLQY